MSDALPLPAPAPGEVWLVGAGPGDPGLLTLLARNALRHADVVFHDALVTPEILALVGPACRLVAVGKRKDRPSERQIRINARLVRAAKVGSRVVRLKGGDPFVFGRGGEEALALRAAGIPFRIVPGVSAGTAAPALAGIPVTHRGVARSVAFVTGHGLGGADPRGLDVEALARGAETLVLFMAASRMDELSARLLAAGRAADEPLAFIAAAATPDQQRIITTLGAAAAVAAELDGRAPILIVLGRVVDMAPVLMPELLRSATEAAPAAAEPLRRAS